MINDAVYFVKNNLKINRIFGIRFWVFYVAYVILRTSWWIGRFFGSPTFEQVLVQFQFGVAGLVGTDFEVLWNYVKHCLLLPLIFAAITVGFLRVLYAICKTIFERVFKVRLIFFSEKRLCNAVSILLFLISCALLFNRIHLWDYFLGFESGSFIEKNYVVPSVDVTDKKELHNLVLIYIESLENGYSDPRVAGKDLLLNLNKKVLGYNSYSFARYEQAYGTGWTIAALVSTQCGLPLKPLTMFDGNSQGENLKKFLPGAVCLGDVLSKFGYTNIFFHGAPIHFAGTDIFLTGHGYSQLAGKEKWLEAGYDKFNGWGLYDSDLFYEARKKIDEMEHKKKRYNLTLMTINTHPPRGFVDPNCTEDDGKNYAGIVQCTVNSAANLIEYMRLSGYLKHTLVVVLGDHLAMEGPLYDKLNLIGSRTIYNKFISPDPLYKNTDLMYEFSMYPTILSALGFSYKGEARGGLGASGFGVNVGLYRPEIMSIDELDSKLIKNSEFYKKLFLGRL